MAERKAHREAGIGGEGEGKGRLHLLLQALELFVKALRKLSTEGLRDRGHLVVKRRQGGQVVTLSGWGRRHDRSRALSRSLALSLCVRECVYGRARVRGVLAAVSLSRWLSQEASSPWPATLHPAVGVGRRTSARTLAAGY